MQQNLKHLGIGLAIGIIISITWFNLHIIIVNKSNNK